MDNPGSVRIALQFMLPVILMMATSIARADVFDLTQLMQLLAATPTTEVLFTEKKYSSLLSAPVVSSGKLRYQRPDIVEKLIELPRKEQYRFVGDDLLLVRNGAEKRIRLSSQPLLLAFAASLRGVLGGDLVLLRTHYQLSLMGAQHSWRLELIPVDEGIGRYVQRIVASGHDGRIAQIEVHEISGDRSVLQVR